MCNHPDALEQSVEDLKQALTCRISGQEQQWLDSVAKAIADVQEKLRQHSATAGLFAEVDITRPTLGRQTDELQREHSNILGELLGLREEIQRVKQAISTSPAMENGGTNPSDLGAIRQVGEKVLVEIQQMVKVEAALVLESVNTDIGVGD